jgi:hypothetical protein
LLVLVQKDNKKISSYFEMSARVVQIKPEVDESQEEDPGFVASLVKEWK